MGSTRTVPFPVHSGASFSSELECERGRLLLLSLLRVDERRGKRGISQNPPTPLGRGMSASEGSAAQISRARRIG